ncbi:MAG: DHH family phosphoesterase [Lachnospiraceae bacterium]|jgi:c-di-AMP phosphodiesterase-like protein|nr:DHH family phosphoesterase [Lachnospiraceae bacterium]MCI5881755.1 DHH family phosphoesterase [Clostridium sp.]CDA68217.1 dHH domain-containing protein [Clostridium sp. CAG:510]MDD6179077.1 DHH family phosphoesterase [Clostridium sp.]MDY4820301.1 DHH family phosphoesterase [Lachnospiraceae bacterium]
MKKRIKLKGRIKTYLQFSIYLGGLLLVVNAGIVAIDYRAGLLLGFFTLFYFAVTLSLYFYNKPVIMNELVSFATQYGQIQKRLLRELELPHALLDDTGKVIWTNVAFENIIHQPKGYNKTITALFPSITRDKLPDNEGVEEAQYELTYDSKEYIAKFKRISLKEMAENSAMIEAEGYEGYLIAVYLFDETALHIALQEVDDQSLSVGLFYLDNYEEALESVEEVRRSLLIALIDRKINKYIAALDGIVKKLEKDKYLVVMRKKSVAQLQSARFDILEDVKTVNIGNEMAVTLSIGVGLDGLTYAQNYEFARNAIDLALGRGGDQAVLKTPESIIYYGGKSQQVEKNTRVKARVKAHALKEIIAGKDKVLIMGHRMADVDSFGSAVGIYRIAQALDRKAHIVLNDVSNTLQPLVDLFKNNPEYDSDMIVGSSQAMEIAGNNAVLVVVDVNRPSITECPDLLRVCKSIVVLDHHRQGTDTIENATLSYVEPYASSACEMVSEILQYTADNIKIRTEEADCMYSGIMIDTNNFMSKTGVRTFEAAAFLRRSGADVTRVRKMFREDAAEYKAKADAVSQAEIYRQSFAISVCLSEDVQSPTIIGAQAANELLNIKGVKASFVLTDYQGKIYVSARSIDEVNVQIIMERMGGGGHMSIAATQLEGISMAEAIGSLKSTIDTMIEEGAI